MLYVAYVCLDVVQSSATKKIHSFKKSSISEATELGLVDDMYNKIVSL